MLIMNQKSFSNGDPLDEVAGDAPAPTVVDLGGAGVGVAGQVLDVLQRHILSEQVRDRHVPELVQREDLRQPGCHRPPLEHAPHVLPSNPVLRGTMHPKIYVSFGFHCKNGEPSIGWHSPSWRATQTTFVIPIVPIRQVHEF